MDKPNILDLKTSLKNNLLIHDLVKAYSKLELTINFKEGSDELIGYFGDVYFMKVVKSERTCYLNWKDLPPTMPHTKEEVYKIPEELAMYTKEVMSSLGLTLKEQGL